MNDNWSEIVEIMGSDLAGGSGKAETKLGLESSLRVLGWRTSTGSMKKNFRTSSGKVVDIVLGEMSAEGSFQAVLPIYIQPTDSESGFTDDILSDLHVKTAIVIGNTMDLYYKDNDNASATCVGKITYMPDDPLGESFSTLLSFSDFSINNLVSFYESLYKEALSDIKLQNLIQSLIADNSKAKEMVKLYLGFEGFEGDIVEKKLENLCIDIYFKDGKKADSNINENVAANHSSENTGHDNTGFSLNGGPFLSKRHFVWSVVSQYINDNPNITLEGLEKRFPSDIASKKRGVVRSWAQVQLWAKETGPDILGRYCSKPNERLTLHDGTEVVVNSQWGARNFPKFLDIAKELYEVTSDAPYSDIKCVDVPNSSTGNRAKNFKFSMVNIEVGECVVFNPTHTEVKVASDDTIEYEGVAYKLSAFVRKFLPDDMRTPSDSYRGPDFFLYNGETLTNLRKKSEGYAQHQEEMPAVVEESKGIQISLQSLKTFKKT